MLPVILKLLYSSKYSDITLVCGESKFNAHRAIICSQSPVLAAMCDGSFKEAKGGLISLNGDDEATVKRMMSYLYTSYYVDSDETLPDTSQNGKPVPQGSGGDSSNDASSRNGSEEGNKGKDGENTQEILTIQARLSNVAVYAIAEKYDIGDLKSLAVEKFAHHPFSYWQNACAKILPRIYTTTTPASDRGLRNLVIDRIVKDRSIRQELLEEEVISRRFKQYRRPKLVSFGWL